VVLKGLRVAVTRAAAQADELAAPLRAAGAEVVLTPLIRIVPGEDTPEIRHAIEHVRAYAWIVFTSVNGVDLFAEALTRVGGAVVLDGPSIACVGPATAEAARKHGWAASVIPEEFVGHAIADALASRADLAGRQILLPRARGARAELPERLRAAGALVTDVELYHAALDEAGAKRLRAHIESDAVDLLTFTSGSTVRYFTQAVGGPGRAKIAVIGPMTADVARRSGLDVQIEAEPHTTAGLVAAIVQHFRGEAQ
jgi:uroporphyrinogen III methyltransferase / synthase